MGTWYLNPAMSSLRGHFDKEWPRRSTRSDGTLGDAAHSARQSEHNPDRDGSVDALDITDDDRHFNLDHVIAELIASGDRRLKRVIRNYRIWQKNVGWSAYGGINGHTLHAHFESDPRYENDGSPWRIPAFGYGAPPVVHLPYPDLTKPPTKYKGDDVGLLFIQHEAGGGVYALSGNILTGIKSEKALEYFRGLNRLQGLPESSNAVNRVTDEVFRSLHVIQP